MSRITGELLCPQPPHRGPPRPEEKLYPWAGTKVPRWTKHKGSKVRGRYYLFPLLCRLNKSASSPKVSTNTITTPLNSAHLALEGECVWVQKQVDIPLQGHRSMANCHFHSWVERSKKHPSTRSPKLLLEVSLANHTPFKDSLQIKGQSYRRCNFANITVWERGVSKAALSISAHAHSHYHRSQAFHGSGGCSLPQRPQQSFSYSLFLFLLLEGCAFDFFFFLVCYQQSLLSNTVVSKKNGEVDPNACLYHLIDRRACAHRFLLNHRAGWAKWRTLTADLPGINYLKCH